MSGAAPAAVATALGAGLVGCRRCTRVWPAGTPRCGRCGARLQSRDPRSLSRVWGWLAAGVLCYIPANLYPMLRTRTLFTTQEDTIIGGTVELARGGNWGIAIVVFVASVMIPVGKFLAIAFLALGLGDPDRASDLRRHRLFEIVEFIGRWSMIDVFVVAILSALVQLSAVASINPGPAAIAFALSVIATMLSAQSFDPRMIWDAEELPAA